VVEKLGEDGKVTRKKIRRERPQDEWRFVDVQPIVTKELWDLANRALVQNKKMSARNSRKFDSLLIGLLKCAHCGYAWVSDHTRNVVRGKTYHRHYYRCSSDRGYNRNHEINCPTDGFVRQEIVDKIVWTAVWSMIFHPEVLLAHIEQQAESDANRQVQDQIDYIKNQIAHRKRTDERDHELFDADYMKIDEYGPKHKEAVEQIKRWEASIEDLKRKLITQADVQAKKARIMALSEKAKRFKHLGVEAPFDYKQNLIKMCVDVIYVDQPEGKVRIIGEIGDYTRSLNEFIVEDRRCNEQDDDRIVNGYASPAS
jgi:site-specific DNA recombinase